MRFFFRLAGSVVVGVKRRPRSCGARGSITVVRSVWWYCTVLYCTVLWVSPRWVCAVGVGPAVDRLCLRWCVCCDLRAGDRWGVGSAFSYRPASGFGSVLCGAETDRGRLSALSRPERLLSVRRSHTVVVWLCMAVWGCIGWARAGAVVFDWWQRSGRTRSLTWSALGWVFAPPGVVGCCGRRVGPPVWWPLPDGCWLDSTRLPAGTCGRPPSGAASSLRWGWESVGVAVTDSPADKRGFGWADRCL